MKNNKNHWKTRYILMFSILILAFCLVSIIWRDGREEITTKSIDNNPSISSKKIKRDILSIEEITQKKPSLKKYNQKKITHKKKL